MKRTLASQSWARNFELNQAIQTIRERFLQNPEDYTVPQLLKAIIRPKPGFRCTSKYDYVVTEVTQYLTRYAPRRVDQFRDLAITCKPIRKFGEIESDSIESDEPGPVVKRTAIEAVRYPLIFESTAPNPTHEINIIYRSGEFEINIQQRENIGLPQQIATLLANPPRTDDDKSRWITDLANLSPQLDRISVQVRGIQEQPHKFQGIYLASPIHGTGKISERPNTLTLQEALSNILRHARHLKLFTELQDSVQTVGRRFNPISDRYTLFKNRRPDQLATSPRGCIVVSPHYSAALNALTQLINDHKSIRTVLVIANSDGESRNFKSELRSKFDRNRVRDGRLQLEAVGKTDLLNQPNLEDWDVVVLLQPETYIKYSMTETTMNIIQKLDQLKNSFIVLYSGALLSNDVSNLWTPLRILHPQYRSSESGLTAQRTSIRDTMNQKFDITEVEKDKLRNLHKTIQCLLAPATPGLRASRITVRSVVITPSNVEQTVIAEIRTLKTNNPIRAQLNQKIMVDLSLIEHNAEDNLGSKVAQLLTQIADIRQKGRCHLTVVIPTDAVAQRVFELLTDAVAGEMNPPELFLANQGKASVYNKTLTAYGASETHNKILILHAAGIIPWIPISSTDLIFFNVTVNLSFYQKMIGLAAVRHEAGAGLQPDTPLSVSYFLQDAAAFADTQRMTELSTIGQIDRWLSTRLGKDQDDPMPQLAARALKEKTTPPNL